MRTKIKRAKTFILTICMLLSILGGISTRPETAHAMTTCNAAVQWARSQVGSRYNEGYGVQCVALISKYCDFLGAPHIYGNANQYVSSAIPAGWIRLAGASPQPGDIAIWTGGYYAQYGHVAIVLSAGVSSFEIIDQNGGGNQEPGTIRTKPYGNGYWGIIRPNFDPESKPDPIRRGEPIPGGDRVMSDGDYHIVSALRGDRFNPWQKCLTTGGLPGALNKNEANMLLWPSLEWSNSVFTVTYLDNGFYKIKLKDSDNKCLDVAGGDTAIGTNVQQWQDDGSNAQKWRIDERADGDGYTIRAACNGWYLDVYNGDEENGTNIRLWEGNGSNAQKWYFVPWGGGNSAKQDLADGEYHIVPKIAPDKALNADGDGVTDETNILLWPCRSDGKHTFCVKWLGNGYYEIINKNSGLALDVSGGFSKRGANVQLYRNLDENNKKWLIRSCGNGYFNVISKCNGLYLDLADAKTDNATNVQLYTGWGIHGADCQKWRFIPWGASIGQTIEDGEYQIVQSADESKTLSVAGNSAENGTNIELNSHKNDGRHTFDVRYLGNGYYSIINRASRLALDVGGGGWNQACNVQLWEQNMEDVQKWMIKDRGDGTYNIISKRSGLNLDLAAGNTADGTNIRVWEQDGTSAQKWKFVPYAAPIVVEAVNLDKKTLTLNVGRQSALKATVTPKNASDQSLTWVSSDSTIAEVDSQGLVTAKAVGTAIITVITKNGKAASCNITIGKEQSGKPDQPEKDDGNNGDNGLLKVGDILTDKNTGNSYIVTSIKRNQRTVAFRKMGNKSKTVFSVPAKITVGKQKYEVTSIADRAFADNEKLNSISFGNSIGSIGDNAFSGCVKLHKIKCGKNLKTIGDNAFSNCQELKSINIPSKVKKIGKQAFLSCKKLKKITIGTKYINKKAIGKQAFKGVYTKATVKVPKGKVSTYRKILQLAGLSKKAKVKS